MNKPSILFINILLILMLRTNGQTIQLGAAGENRDVELSASDPVNDKHYYWPIPFMMKKGQGALFTIRSTAFKPHVFLSSPTAPIAWGELNESGTVAAVTFIASSDTAFLIIFTSTEENKTGKFNFSYKLLDSLQMQFSESYSTCQRLAYLINHSLLGWELIPHYTKTYFDDDYPENIYELKTTNRTLKGGSAKVHGGYEEIMYTASLNPTDNARKYYDKICGEVKKCLGADLWDVKTETITNIRSTKEQPYGSDITLFTIKESEKAKLPVRIRIEMNTYIVLGWQKYEVKLIF